MMSNWNRYALVTVSLLAFGTAVACGGNDQKADDFAQQSQALSGCCDGFEENKAARLANLREDLRKQEQDLAFWQKEYDRLTAERDKARAKEAELRKLGSDYHLMKQSAIIMGTNIAGAVSFARSVSGAVAKCINRKMIWSTITATCLNPSGAVDYICAASLKAMFTKAGAKFVLKNGKGVITGSVEDIPIIGGGFEAANEMKAWITALDAANSAQRAAIFLNDEAMKVKINQIDPLKKAIEATKKNIADVEASTCGGGEGLQCQMMCMTPEEGPVGNDDPAATLCGSGGGGGGGRVPVDGDGDPTEPEDPCGASQLSVDLPDT